MISISYSISEHFLSFYEVVIFDIEAIKLSAQGVTIVAGKVYGELVWSTQKIMGKKNNRNNNNNDK